jgi:hypothetical protein
MTTEDHTPKHSENPDSSVNDALSCRWRYFVSFGGTMLLSCFDSAPIEHNPYFLEIDRIEYEHLCKELKS